MKTLESMLDFAHQFIKIRIVFHTPYLWNEAGDPQLSIRSRSLKKIYRVENFVRASLKVQEK